MIFFLLSILSLASAKVLPRPGVNVLDGVEGVIYEIPEYEDPEIALYKLASKGLMPVFTALAAVMKSEDSAKEKDTTRYYQIDDIKEELHDVIGRLQVAKSKLENGNNHIFMDIDKSVHYLMNLKNRLYADIHSDDVIIPVPVISDDCDEHSVAPDTSRDQYLLPYISVHQYLASETFSEKPLASETSSEKPLASDASDSYTSTEQYLSSAASVPQRLASDASSKQILYSGASSDVPFASDFSIHLLPSDASSKKSSASDKDQNNFKTEEEMSSVDSLFITERPDFKNIRPGKKVKTLLGDDIYISETKEYERGEKAAIHKKWAWKSSSIA